MNVRLAIFTTLNAIYKEKEFSNLAVGEALKTNDLSPLDSAFFTNVVYGVLQNSLLLDHIIKSYAPKHKITAKMRTILKMSYYQLYFMDKVPEYAITNEAVEIMKQDSGRGSADCANAVIHSMIKQKYEFKESDFPDLDTYYAFKYSIPLWLYKMVVKHYGAAAAFKWASLSKVPPVSYVRVNTLKSTKAEILKNKDFSDSPDFPDCVIYNGKGSAANTQEYLNGKITIQDISAQQVAPLLDPKPTDSIIDLCAAPGSKTTHLAALLNNEGKIIANDLYPQRVQLIASALKRLGIKDVVCTCDDVLKMKDKYPAAYFDKVLLDAPCTGFGVIRRKPDILLSYIEQTNNLDEIITLQRFMLDVAYYLVKPNGIIVYSTCTLDKKENETQVAQFVAKHPDIHLVSEKLLLPTETSGDGFYMAKLTKE